MQNDMIIYNVYQKWKGIGSIKNIFEYVDPAGKERGMSQANIANMKKQIDRISKEVTLIKRMLIHEGVIDKKKTGTAWKSLLDASKQISKSGKARPLLRR